MNFDTPIIITSALVAATIVYKLIPHRTVRNKKPFLTFFPKYRKDIKLNLTHDQLVQKLSEFGLKEAGTKNDFVYFKRGNILGDISIKVIKVKLGFKKMADSFSEVTVEGGWFILLDTGDVWRFLGELTDKLENG